MKKIIIFSLTLLWLVACERPSSSVVPCVTFDLSSAKQMDMLEFVDSIYLIPLETNDSSLVKEVRTLEVTTTSVLIEDRGYLLAFDKEGNFLYSTRTLQGPGGKEYRSGMDFTILPNGNLEVFDVSSCKLIIYDEKLQYLSEHKLPRDIYPVSGCLFLSEDYRLFINKGNLRLYSIKENDIIDIIEGLDVPHFAFFNRSGFQFRDDGLYLSTKNQNVYYKLAVDSLRLKLIPVGKFDFGNNANFDLSQLPEGMNEKFYIDYFKSNANKAFVERKVIDGNKWMCFFFHDKKLCFAYQNFQTGLNQIYYNETMTKGQFPQVDLYSNNTFYYACEPQYLEYVIDESLMSFDDKEKMKSIREDDNPVIICYKLK